MCEIGFYDVNGQCTKISCPDVKNCGICETSTTCQTCNDQYYLLGNNKNECKSKFLVVNKVFKIGCEYAISNCAICESQSVCRDCKEGYFWNGNACQGNYFFSLLNNK